jgi:hypothetical protein
MARIRTVKPEFWTSEQITDCSPNARLLFIGIWTFSDDNGVHAASIKRLKMEVFPSDDFTQADISTMVDELVAAGLLNPYQVGGEGYWQVTGWQHQKIDQPTFKHPLPDGTLPRNVRRRFAEPDSTNKVRGSFAEHGSSDAQGTFDERSPPEGKGREGKVEEGKELQSSLRSDSSTPATMDPTTQPPADLKLRRTQRIQQIADDAQGAYNRILAKPSGLLTACTVLNKPRMKAVEKSLATAKILCKTLYGSERVTAQFWDDYFAEAAQDGFHSGQGPYRPPHENWRPDFEFLLREDVMAKLFDRAQSADNGEAAA